MLRFKPEKAKATRFTLDIEGDVQQYALSFLQIINNAREYPQVFYKVENTYNNTVYVTCDERRKDSARGFLSDFGKITDEEEIVWITISAEYDSKGWDWLYSDDREVDFTVDIQ